MPSKAVPYFVVILAIEAIVLGSKRMRVGDALCSISSGLFMELVRYAPHAHFCKTHSL